MRKTVLVAAIPLAVAAPVAGQMSLGVRAGIGSAWMARPFYVGFGPCATDTDCPDAAQNPVDGLTFGADLDILISDIVVSDSIGVFSLRVGAAYIEKGGKGARGALATSYLQFSALLRVRVFRNSGRSSSLVLLAGPWVGTQLSCEREGRLAASCEATDAGVALGGGVELALPRTSRASVALELMFYNGMREHSKYDETTRFSGIQVGLVYTVG